MKLVTKIEEYREKSGNETSLSHIKMYLWNKNDVIK